MINVDKEKCLGCGACVATCPEVFELGADGKAQVKADAKLDATCVQSAKDGCPVSAIVIG
jgi:ferredoxin